MVRQYIVLTWLTIGVGLCTNSAFAQQRQTGFVELPSQHAVYIDYVPAAPLKPLLVIVNGFTYDTTNWDDFVAGASTSGLGILRYDALGMGQTLSKNSFAAGVIPIENQAVDLKLLLDALKIKNKINLLGLSYGAAVALVFSSRNPQYVQNCILMAPFLDAFKSQDSWIQQQIARSRILNPLNLASDEQLYNYFFKSFAKAVYPIAEPSLLTTPAKLDAVIAMALGMKEYSATKLVANLSTVHMHLLVPRKDQYTSTLAQEDFWRKLPATARSSLLYVQDSENKLPDVLPKFSAAWVSLIINEDSRLSSGAIFEGIPAQNIAKSSTIQITLPKD